MRKQFIIANWKMNPESLAKAENILHSLRKGLANSGKRREIIICSPFVYLLRLKDALKGSKIFLGAQDVFWEEKGAYTGEISAVMLKNIGVKYVIVGHSERRNYFKETDEIINRKIKSLLKSSLNPILCVGETKQEKESGKKEDSLKRQIKKAFEGIPKSKFNPSNLFIAYEPVWAIGKEKPCRAEKAREIAFLLRKIISNIYGQEVADQINILYGGSVNAKNYHDFLSYSDINGLLVGRASFKIKEFVKMAKID